MSEISFERALFAAKVIFENEDADCAIDEDGAVTLHVSNGQVFLRSATGWEYTLGTFGHSTIATAPILAHAILVPAHLLRNASNRPPAALNPRRLKRL